LPLSGSGIWRRYRVPLFDQERLVNLTSELRKSVQRLSALSQLSEREFVSDPDKIGSAKYHLIVAIEVCIDICTHLISRNGYRVPENYADTFAVMSEVGALDSAFSEELMKMAKFRNRLVHLYWQVDNKQVYEILVNRRSDFKRFLDCMASFLGWNAPASAPN
jgi:uncharacterized protein YutE (UPF0331/DUF86 family)